MPSSSSSHKWKYDVFVSFRGPDVRKTFLSHLCRELGRVGLRCFRDNDIKDIGEEVSVKIFRAISYSRFAIVLFSEDFAASEWCLDELAQILMCRRKLKKQGHVVIPVFFGVDATELSKLTSRTKFWQGFKSLCRKARDKEKIPKWKLALAKAKSISGFDLQKHANGDQASFIEQIVGRLLKIIPRTSSPDAIGVGLVPSSSASVHRWKYDVFVSFRGGEIRNNVAAHFFHALKQAGIYYFGDNEKEETGILIEGKLPDAIRHSRVSLVVFTANYADSRWCLNELVEILECNRRFRDHQGHVVLPIFYDVEPCDVRKQSGQFGDGFERCLATHTDDLLVQKWRDSLKEAGNLSGWHFNNDANGDQASFIEQIVGRLLKIIPRTSSPDAIGVGLVPSSSASVHRWKYDVFVSFRGGDIRKNFASHFLHALRQAGICFFWDNDKVETGIFIEPKLVDAIRNSSVALIMFTTNYADSWWCLNELLEILECNRRFRDHQGHVVLPIFFDVEPGDVRKQSGQFGDGFENLAAHTDDLLVQKWRDALKEAGNLSGWHLNNDANGVQSNFIEQIVGHLLTVSPRAISPYLVKNVIGVDSFVEDVISSLEIWSEDDVRVIGIWGMKGIGKTTVAKVVCNRVIREFEGVSLLENVGDANQDKALLQKKLLHDVLKVQGLETFDLHSNINEIKTKLCHKRILLVLDNITKKDQIEYFGAGDRDWFQHGSRILITTRDERLLEDIQVDNKHMLPGLTDKQSLELLSHHAFRKDHPKEGYEELSKRLVHYTGGLPIALKIFGSFLSKKRENQWHEILEKLVRDPHLDSVGLPLEPFSSVLPFQSVGPIGGPGGSPYDDKTYTDVRKITVVVMSGIVSFSIEYEQDGCLVRSPRHGGPTEGRICTVKLDYPNEFLTSVSGYFMDDPRFIAIQSLTFHSNRRTFGPFGYQRGKFFSFPPAAGKIIGFFGMCGSCLNSIGAYVLPISRAYPFEIVGPFGNSNYEDRWDDGKHTDVRQIDVVSGSAIESITITYERGRSFAHGTGGGGTTNKIILDWLSEYLTSVSGYITSGFGSTIIHSLTFQSNKRRYGPFGAKTGRKFSFPATGGKIIGFFGSSDSHLQSLGAYFKPISHLYPIEFIGPFGGQGGHCWDDGKFNGVKKIKMMLEDVVSCISFEYDDNGESILSSTHGHSGSGDIHMVNLDYPHEFLTSVSGYIKHDNSVIQSLTVESNIKRHGPFGKEEGRFFSCALACSKIIGFHGRSGIQLDALGVYSEPISDLHLLKSIGPFGGQGGSPWHNRDSTGVRKIIVKCGSAIDSITVEYDKNGSVVQGPKHGGDGGHLTFEIKLDYPREYLTSFSGHFGSFFGYTVVRSLTFFSNERTYGPFGEEVGEHFHFPSIGKKIVGFHGRSGVFLDSLGAYFEP